MYLGQRSKSNAGKDLQTDFKEMIRFSGIGLFSALTWGHGMRYEEQPHNFQQISGYRMTADPGCFP